MANDESMEAKLRPVSIHPDRIPLNKFPFQLQSLELLGFQAWNAGRQYEAMVYLDTAFTTARAVTTGKIATHHRTPLPEPTIINLEEYQLLSQLFSSPEFNS